MKQHITQFELDDYLQHQDEQTHIPITEWLVPGSSHHAPKDASLITIGKMIEFLDERANTDWDIRFHNPFYDVNYPDSPVTPDYEDYKELCDALWEAVKDVLEKHD